MHTCSRNWQCALRSKACRRAEGLVSRTAERQVEKREQSVPVSDSVAQGPLSPIQAQNDGSGCSDRGEPTNESLPNGSTPIGSRRRRDGGATSVFVAFDSAGKNRTGPRGERAQGGRSAKRARDSCSDRCSTGTQQPEVLSRGRGRDTGWDNLRLRQQQKCTGRTAASWCSCAPPVCCRVPPPPQTWRLMGPPLIASCQEACCAASPTR
jgi:hypothetical protein